MNMINRLTAALQILPFTFHLRCRHDCRSAIHSDAEHGIIHMDAAIQHLCQTQQTCFH